MKREAIVRENVYVPAKRPRLTASNGVKWRRVMDRLAEKLIFLFALIAISIIFLIFVYVAREAFPLIAGSPEGISLSSPFTAPFVWQPVSGVPKFNVLPLILGTFK